MILSSNYKYYTIFFITNILLSIPINASKLQTFSGNLVIDSHGFDPEPLPSNLRATWQDYKSDRISTFLDGTLKVLSLDALQKSWESLTEEDKKGVPARDLYLNGLPSTIGLDRLNAVGVNQFNKNQLENIVSWIRSEKPGAPITLIDHREEPHGHFEGHRVLSTRNHEIIYNDTQESLPISLYALSDAYNMGKDLFDMEEVEKDFIDHVAEHAVISLLNIQKKSQGMTQGGDIQYFQVTNAYNENYLAGTLGLGYARIGITDFSAFESDDGSHFQLMGDALPTEVIRIYHCRGGKGRTTTGLIIHDILKNGLEHRDTLSIHDIALRHYLLGGSHLLNPVIETEESGWKQELAFKRAKRIYDYHHFILKKSSKTRSFYHREVKK